MSRNGAEEEGEEEEEEITPPLSAAVLKEILNGSLISGDHINKFHEILSACTDYKPQNVFFIGVLQFVKPVRTEHIQILPARASDNVNQITHWICTFYDRKVIHIYDSLNGSYLTSGQRAFLRRLFPHEPHYVYEPVQNQPNTSDCGVFAVAFATSIAYNRDPKREVYIHNRMRPHMYDILRRNALEPFPTFVDLNEDDEFIESYKPLDV